MLNILRFDPFEIDLTSGVLHRGGSRVRLPEKPFQVLAALLEHPGEVVTREELRRRLWSDEVFVDFDNNLNTAIARLREALGDSADRPHFIETLPKRGYRFLASVFEPPSAPQGAPKARVRLLVLPFLNLSGDPAQEYFSDAVTDEIITALASLAQERLAVIARTTAMRYKGSRKDVARIGHELGVDCVVEGGVHRAEGRIGINVQLIQVADQSHIFARKYDADLRDLFSVERSTAEAIAAHLDARLPADSLRPEEAALPRERRKPTEDLAAYNSYIQGRYHLNKYTPEGLAKARQYLEEALRLDPEFALANDALGELYWYLGFFGLAPPREACSTGLFYALRAVEIDSNLAETHALIGMYRKELDYNWPEVEREMRRALELDPASPVVRMRRAQSGLMPLGRLEEAVAELERALERDPMSHPMRVWLAVLLWLGRDFDRSVVEARRALELDEANFMGHLVLGQALTMRRQFEEAIPALQRATELSGGAPAVLGWLGLALAQSGNNVETRNLLERLHAIATQAYVPPTSFAWIHLGLGEINEAFAWMDGAIEARDPMMVPIKSYCFLDPLRADPRFAALLRKMRLEPEPAFSPHTRAAA